MLLYATSNTFKHCVQFFNYAQIMRAIFSITYYIIDTQQLKISNLLSTVIFVTALLNEQGPLKIQEST